MILWAGIGLLVAAMFGLTRLLARLQRRWGRAGVWLLTGAAVLYAEHLLITTGPVGRMVGLCVTLLAGMKGVVYVEWCRGGVRRLGWWRHFAFALLWFGMDPGLFARQRKGLGGGRMIAEGGVCMLAGTLLALGVHALGWRSVWALFVPLSVGFHFGALRALAGAWRLAGVPVKPLFRNPFGATSAADFWARRWNLGYSHMMALAVGRPLESVLGVRGAVFVVFAVSGLLHEVAITLPVRAGFGQPTLCFMFYGLMALVSFPRWPLWLRRVLSALSILLPLPWLFPREFCSQVLVPLLEVVPAALGKVLG